MANPHFPGKRSRFVTIDVSHFIVILLRGLSGALMRLPTFCSNVVNILFCPSLSHLILSAQCFTTLVLVHTVVVSKRMSRRLRIVVCLQNREIIIPFKQPLYFELRHHMPYTSLSCPHLAQMLWISSSSLLLSFLINLILSAQCSTTLFLVHGLW